MKAKVGTLLSLRQVRAIDAVAHHASLATASAHLGTSQSTLSRHVAEAERQLGRQLFQRGWAGMEPTSEGELVIAHCRALVTAINTAGERLGPRAGAFGHHLTWEMLQAVDAVTQTGSVSAAAAYLEVSQPEVSRLLGRLAAAVGKPVFQRGGAGMVPTADAASVSDLHDTLLLNIAPMPEQLALMAGEVTGRVAVGLLPFSEQDVVVKAFGSLLRRHRHVRLKAVTGSYAALIDGLRQGELDFTLGLLRDPAPFDTLQELRLSDETFALVVRARHPLGVAPALADLIGESWIVAPHGTPSRSFFESWLLAQGYTPPAQTCEIVTFFLAEQMILNSDSIGLLTYSERRRANLASNLRLLPILLPESRRPIGLTFRKGQTMSDVQRLFVQTLSKLLDPTAMPPDAYQSD